MRKIRTYHEVGEAAGSEVVEQVGAQQERLARRLERIGRVVAVVSGKGGVGKSAVTANLAALLAARGRRVGALDADLNGPSLGRMLGALGRRFEESADGIRPPTGVGEVRVASMELLQDAEDAPLRWRDPGGHAFIWQSSLEAGVLRELLSDVTWGELDVLLIDVPPGTDKIARLLQIVPDLHEVLLVTTPSEMARAVVARSARLVREAGVSRVGIVANMTEHVCSGCGRRTPLYAEDGAERLASETGFPIVARIPFDPRLASATDAGSPPAPLRPDSSPGRAFADLARHVEEVLP